MHFHYLDKRLVEAFKDANIDYMIWMTPYKRYSYASNEIQPPKVVLYDLKDFKCKLLEYDEDKMVSAEK